MKVTDIKIKRAGKPLTVTDAFVDKGLVPGGHAALPDIDVDYASDRRQEIKEYLEERYNTGGRRRVFSAGTFTTMQLKAALKDVARVHRVPHHTVNYITAMLDDGLDWTGLFRMAAANRKLKDFIRTYPEVIEDVRLLLGQPRAASVHASAIIVTPETRDGRTAECFDFLPVRKTDGMLVSEFDGYSVDEIGLLKEDVLATKELTKLSAVIALVNEHYKQELSVERITSRELEDEKTYRLLAEGNTQNVFQFSSPGITRFIQDVRPDCIEDLIAVNALYRPATLDIGATEDYIRYRRGEVAPVYDYGCYKATKNTFGIMVYQEQFMSVAHTLGGFDLGKTDLLRKAIGKKKADLMATLKADFIAGAIRNGCPDYEAETIWHKIEVAGKYSFNRSHAAAYALTAYCGAWLKANFPSAFYTVALQWADDREIPALMSEMERCSSAKIVPPDINRSGMEFFTDYATDEIFWSLTRIRQVGVKTVEYIVSERARGPFESVENFIHRVFRYKLKKYKYWDDPDNPDEAVKVPVNARHVKNMILAGCFDRVEKVRAVTERHVVLERAARELGFALPEKDFPAEIRDRHYFWSQQQIAVSGIGSIDYRRIFDNSAARAAVKGKASYLSLEEVARDGNDGRRAAICATVAEVTEHLYKDRETGSSKRFAKLTLSQNNRLVECVCWNDYYAAHRAEIQSLKDKVVIITAMVRYSDYSGCNTLQTTKNSLLFIQ
ncbi:helix-hairpin-helix domain-containing protein [Parabacteroides merdae]|uniref:DNA-directed DNA polymerase n=1 Tax=Parabacteroides merdae TaxID=46503 RepID=A0AA44ALC3_9BACT|nr:DNA polymerase III subunit alpha [Parabacteroides merdae]MTU52781.1 DNA polymerase III subunit alpha [Parabacteroides merdae]MTU61578.1 DNA polymerase III subunit alpha [Parabacteroides merdae]MTU64719.1 DNA polymerase III subunit alpha [Parabacteroides merdae]MTU68029.1 DNA polymerase III subunit alpha [Parabacteroides merdae]MTU84681.1 DNA polymerase III subunit alpha [Parabacteroides merdae]